MRGLSRFHKSVLCLWWLAKSESGAVSDGSHEATRYSRGSGSDGSHKAGLRFGPRNGGSVNAVATASLLYRAATALGFVLFGSPNLI